STYMTPANPGSVMIVTALLGPIAPSSPTALWNRHERGPDEADTPPCPMTIRPYPTTRKGFRSSLRAIPAALPSAAPPARRHGRRDRTRRAGPPPPPGGTGR